DPPQGEAFHAWALPVAEVQGLVWLYWHVQKGRPSNKADGQPPRFNVYDNPDYSTYFFTQTMTADVFVVVENILDVPHTRFIHRGWFRAGAPRKIRVRRELKEDGVVEAHYLDEPRPGGIVGKLLAPQGGNV